MQNRWMGWASLLEWRLHHFQFLILDLAVFHFISAYNFWASMSIIHLLLSHSVAACEGQRLLQEQFWPFQLPAFGLACSSHCVLLLVTPSIIWWSPSPFNFDRNPWGPKKLLFSPSFSALFLLLFYFLVLGISVVCHFFLTSNQDVSVLWWAHQRSRSL